MSRRLNISWMYAAVLAAALGVAGCATPVGPGYYHRGEALFRRLYQ